MKPDRNQFLGKVLGAGYQVQRFVGAGAFAYVYYAVGPRGEVVAVKVQYSSAEDARKRFAREIKVLKNLPASEYCVRFYDDGHTPEGFPFLVMEFVDGTTLKNTLKHKPVWAGEEACQFMSQLCTAFAGLHELGLAHRDVKPENIMLTRDWRVKLMDLGLVKDAQGLLHLFESEDILAGRDFAENLDRGVLAGTPEYMAPEQFSDPSLEDERLAQTDTTTDVYSLGLIFYELLTGQRTFPFRPDSSSQSSYARSLLEYLKFRTNASDANLRKPSMIPDPLWTVLIRALRHDPKLRQRNAVELGSDIKRYLQTGQGVQQLDEEKTSAIDLATFLAAHESRGGATGAHAKQPMGRQTLPLEPIQAATGKMPAQMGNPNMMPGNPTMPGNPMMSQRGHGMTPPPMQAMHAQGPAGAETLPVGGFNPYLPSAQLPPGYDPAPHAQPTNPYLGYGQTPYTPPRSTSTILLWALLIVLVLGGAGAAVALVLL